MWYIWRVPRLGDVLGMHGFLSYLFSAIMILVDDFALWQQMWCLQGHAGYLQFEIQLRMPLLATCMAIIIARFIGTYWHWCSVCYKTRDLRVIRWCLAQKYHNYHMEPHWGALLHLPIWKFAFLRHHLWKYFQWQVLVAAATFENAARVLTQNTLRADGFGMSALAILGIRRLILWVQEISAASVLQTDSTKKDRNSCQDVVILGLWIPQISCVVYCCLHPKIFPNSGFTKLFWWIWLSPLNSEQLSATEDSLISTRPGLLRSFGVRLNLSTNGEWMVNGFVWLSLIHHSASNVSIYSACSTSFSHERVISEDEEKKAQRCSAGAQLWYQWTHKWNHQHHPILGIVWDSKVWSIWLDWKRCEHTTVHEWCVQRGIGFTPRTMSSGPMDPMDSHRQIWILVPGSDWEWQPMLVENCAHNSLWPHVGYIA